MSDLLQSSLDKAFRLFDTNSNRKISLAENIQAYDIANEFKELDLNND